MNSVAAELNGAFAVAAPRRYLLSSLTSLLTSDDTREAHSFLESHQYYITAQVRGAVAVRGSVKDLDELAYIRMLLRHFAQVPSPLCPTGVPRA